MIDLVLAQKESDAVDIALHAFVLEGEHCRQIELGLNLDAHGGKSVGGLRIELARMQQRLGGDAADIEAGAAMRGALLDHGDLHAQLRGADGADIAAWPRADDDHIVTHDFPACPLLRRQRFLAFASVPQPRQAAVLGEGIDHRRGAAPLDRK